MSDGRREFRFLSLAFRGLAPVVAFAAFAAIASQDAPAQSPASPSPPNAALVRAQALATAGNRAAALRLVDSVLADTDPAQPGYAEALYWRGAMAPSPLDGRKDLLRLIVEFPFSSRVGDALFRLAGDEMDAGDRAGARRHLERVVRDHASSASGAEAAFQLGRLLMDDGDVRAACAALDSAIAYERPESVERRNRIAYLRRPCDRIRAEVAEPAPLPANLPDSSARGRGATTPVRDTRRTNSGSGRASSGGRGTPVTSRWSVQVAAMEKRADATSMAAQLKARGHDARVTGTGPFRVRIGRFATRNEAETLVARLRAEKTTAIVVEAERP